MPDNLIITPAQCLGARAMLGWSRGSLAERAGVAQATLADFEAGKRSPYPRTLVDIRNTLEAAGVTFLGEGEQSTSGGAGVRLGHIPDHGLPVSELNASNDD